MSIGMALRKLLGKKLTAVAAKYYRRVFVDLEQVAAIIGERIPPQAHVLDIGGGDGAPLNHLLRLREDVTVTMIDLSRNIGNSILPGYLPRVRLLPGVSIRQYLEHFMETEPRPPRCVIVSDVIHHVPPNVRRPFFCDLHDLQVQTGATLFLKDVEPGYFISWLGYMSDYHISGDKNVSLLSQADLTALVWEVFSEVKVTESPLFSRNRPNYLIAVSTPPAAQVRPEAEPHLTGKRLLES